MMKMAAAVSVGGYPEPAGRSSIQSMRAASGAVANRSCTDVDGGAARSTTLPGDRNRPHKQVHQANIIVLSAERQSVREMGRRAGVCRQAPTSIY
ncbi:hypothetical protein [Azospirillum endophyticum]